MTRAVRGPSPGGWQWRLLLPPGWVTFPVEGEPARAAVRRALDDVFAGQPRDQVAPLRIEADRALRDVLAQARDAGATAVHALVRPVRGMPVSASLTVAVVPLVPDQEGMSAELSAALGHGDDVVESGGGTVDGLPALRRRRRWKGAVDTVSAEEVWQTAVDWLVPTPDGDELLVLTFATLTDTVADELVTLFDAITSSLELLPLPA